MELKEKKYSSKRIFEGQMINLRVDSVQLPDGKCTQREIVEHPGAVAVVPVLNNNIILVRQFRAPIGQVILEIPAGKLDPGEKPENCALRELEEETGYSAKKLEHLITFYTSPGFSDEIMYVYLAAQLVKAHKNPDDDEFIETVQIPVTELLHMIENGEIVDGKTLSGILAAAQFKAGEDINVNQ